MYEPSLFLPYYFSFPSIFFASDSGVQCQWSKILLEKLTKIEIGAYIGQNRYRQLMSLFRPVYDLLQPGLFQAPCFADPDTAPPQTRK
jgi:hypothetical protein